MHHSSTSPAQGLLIHRAAALFFGVLAVAAGCSSKQTSSSTAASSSSLATSSGASSAGSSGAPGSTTTSSSSMGSSSSAVGQSTTGSTSPATTASSGTGSSATNSSSSSGGSTGAAPSVTLAMSLNPKCVLTAVATVSVTGSAIQQVGVQITDSAGADAGSTPFYPVSSPAGTVVPVLMLKAATAYTFQAVGLFPDGGSISSNVAPLQTAPLPLDVPHFFVVDGGNPSGGYTLVGAIPALPIGPINTNYYAVAVDGTGAPVWYLSLPSGLQLVGDFEKQANGHYTVAAGGPVHIPILGRPGNYIEYDALGNVINNWATPDCDSGTNEHDFRILPDGTGLLMGYLAQTEDLSKIVDGGDPTATVFGNRLERLAPDGGLLWWWSEFGEIPITDATQGVVLTGTIIDPYHDNAFDIATDGNYLLSINKMSEIVKINSSDGGIMWILGGPRSNFTYQDDRLGGLSYQHGIRELPNGHLIAMDNGNYHNPPQSRGAEYAMDYDAGTATLVWQSEHKPILQSDRFGNAQRLPNGGTLVAYGEYSPSNETGLVDEIAPDGGVVWELIDSIRPLTTDGGLGLPDIGIYRAFRVDTLY